MKVCFKCGVTKAVSEFYKHSETADGYLGKCKECTKQDVRENRAKRHDYYLAYEHNRYDTPARQEMRQKKNARMRALPTQIKRQINSRKQQRYRPTHRAEQQARMKVYRAIKSGRLERGQCEVCGTNDGVQAHHTDYTKPLEVRWFCSKHHGEQHRRR